MKLKNIERKLVYELMKNCRQSDREMAKKIGVSQPTVTRVRSKLEKSGIVKEYAMVPDFGKLGFDIMAFTFLRYKREMTAEEYEKVKVVAKEYEQKFPTPFLMALKGIGLGFDRVIVTFHENYSSYTEMLSRLRQLPFTAVDDVQSFLVSLDSTEHYQPCTLSKMAEYLLSKK
jgi:DNA-binding Lrp family transcriptional regulator